MDCSFSWRQYLDRRLGPIRFAIRFMICNYSMVYAFLLILRKGSPYSVCVARYSNWNLDRIG